MNTERYDKNIILIIMADTTETIEKHYCYPTEQNGNNCAMWAALMSKNNESNPYEMAALMNGGGFGGGWNNPLMYIMYMWLFRYMNGNGWGYGDGEGINFNNRALSQIQASIDNNHNTDLTMEAIRGNAGAIHELATNLNVDYNTMSQAICGIKSAIEHVGANVGFSSERVINAINSGDANLISAIQSTACATQKSILEMGYKNELATERQTGILGSKIDAFRAADQLQNCQQTNALQNTIYQSTNSLQSSLTDNRQTMVNGFSNIGYTMAQDTCSIIQSGKDNTQRIIDTLNCHWNQNQTLALADAKNQISNMQQTQTILAAINGNGCCNN